MYVNINGSRESAKARFAAKGWRPGAISINGAAIETVHKGYAIVAFHPTDPNLASMPCVGAGMPFGGGFEPLPPDDPLYGEAMDCLCASAAMD